jgi:hypothetical protein
VFSTRTGGNSVMDIANVRRKSAPAFTLIFFDTAAFAEALSTPAWSALRTRSLVNGGMPL